jgi:hypothetical protein
MTNIGSGKKNLNTDIPEQEQPETEQIRRGNI